MKMEAETHWLYNIWYESLTVTTLEFVTLFCGSYISPRTISRVLDAIFESLVLTSSREYGIWRGVAEIHDYWEDR